MTDSNGQGVPLVAVFKAVDIAGALIDEGGGEGGFIGTSSTFSVGNKFLCGNRL